MKTEKLISKLFDYQKFERNNRLDKIISDSLNSKLSVRELEDDELNIWAAGDAQALRHDLTEKKDD